MSEETFSATVAIPTRNRRDLLRSAIRSALNQTVAVEVIVLDDGSTDGTAEMVRTEFPQVRYSREEHPRGPTFQRNRGAKLATTSILVTLDDDCILQSPTSIAQTLEQFDDPRIGAVTIPFINILKEQVVRSAAPSSEGVHVTFEFFGGMVAFRRDVFQAVGGYRDFLFMHVEESDLAIRMLNAGYVVRLGNCSPIHHYESPERDRSRLDELGPRNHVLYSWYNVPLPHFPVHLLATSFHTLTFGLRGGFGWQACRGLASGYAGCLHEWRRRAPIRGPIYRLSRELKRRGSLTLESIESRLPPSADVCSTL